MRVLQMRAFILYFAKCNLEKKKKKLKNENNFVLCQNKNP